MNVFKKKKLINFLDNIENKQLIVWFLTLCSYVILFVLFHNSFVLLFGYFACFLVYSKLYDFMLEKIKISFKENNANSDIL